MLIPIIKDFNNAFSYLVSNSVGKTKEIFDPVSKSLLHLSENQSDQSGAFNEIFKIGWTSIRICFGFFIQTIQYIVSFQWLRDFAYLPISIPNNILRSNENNAFIQNFNNSIVSLVGDRQNVLQRFLFSNQTIAKDSAGLAIDSQSLPYNNFILGLPNVTHSGVPINSWSLSFLSNKWFDPLTVPVNFLSTGLESGSKNTLSSFSDGWTSDLRISNLILMSILICIATGFSSFVNSFFISFPLSLSNLLSLRYLVIQKFWAGCVSILGIVLGEITFMLFLILPPPFIQITLVYLESVWPYILGLSLIIFIIFDLVSNPYTNTMSIYQTNSQAMSRVPLPASSVDKLPPKTRGDNNWTRFLPIKLGNNTAKIFGFSFLLALTEQSCYFSFFGSLNLSSTGNFLDTYLFAASKSPIVLLFSCLGFLIGSFLAIIIYNLVIAKTIFLIASLVIKIKRYNPNFIRSTLFNRQSSPWGEAQTNFDSSMDKSKDLKNNGALIRQNVIRVTYNIMYRLRNLFFYIASKDFLKSLLLGFKNFIQLFISYLPGGKRIIFFLFPGQAHSYKADPAFQATSLKQNFGNQAEEQLTTKNQFGQSRFQNEPKNAITSIETNIENMLRADGSPTSSTDITSKDSLFTNNQVSGNTTQLGGSAFYNKIDKVLLTCLITLSFTTIPYYSFDYLINSFFGFVPQDQILNAHSLRVNFPDYTNLLGITLSDNNSVINTDVSLYDRAHFMYGEWPNSFESLNYQGELMWTNLRDHRRQKRTRRSTRLKFKTLKTKISTSWKEFKRNSGFDLSTRPSSFEDYSNASTEMNRQRELDLKLNGGLENSDSRAKEKKRMLLSNGVEPNTDIDTKRGRVLGSMSQTAAQKSLRNTNRLSNLFYKIFLASSLKGFNEEASLFSHRVENRDAQGNDQKEYPQATALSKTSSPTSTKSILKTGVMSKMTSSIRRSTSLSETIKPLSTSTFIDLSGGEKYIKTYPKNWKRVITEKYYQNPIYQNILSNDLKNFLKREPSTQQLTNNQEKELYFLRVKMAHYYDSLRFYFNLKEQINSTRSKADGADFGSSLPDDALANSHKEKKPFRPLPNIFSEETSRFNSLNNKKDFEKIWNDKQKPRQSSVAKIKSEPIISGVQESLNGPPFQFKSMTSMNYRQQFKGTLKTVKQLFAISPPESVSSFENVQFEQNSTNDSAGGNRVISKEPNQSINAFSKSIGGREPIEKSYKYDKYLFNEYPYSKNEFLHEEGRGFTNKKSNISNLRESPYQNSTFSSGSARRSTPNEATGGDSTGKKGNVSSNESMGSRGYRGIGLATKNIYNMFGSNDPFYVGWDQNLRKFVLTSRTLSRSSALSYNAFNNGFDNSKTRPRPSSINIEQGGSETNDRQSLTNQRKNMNNKKELNTPKLPPYDSIPIYSTKDINKKLEENQRNVNEPSVHLYRPYTSWPFLKHQLKNLPNRSYFVLYENYLNILNKRIHLFRNININDIDTKSLTFLYSYSFNNNVKKYVSQLPINIYKQSMRPSSLENLFTPISNARSSFLWPGSTMPAWEYYFW